MTRTAIAAGAVAWLTGCALTYNARYDPNAFSPSRIAQNKKIEGRVLILTSPAVDAFVYTGRPKGYVGSMTRLVLPLGVMLREASVRVFGDLFAGGADVSHDASWREGYRAVVAPRFGAFSYDYRMFRSPRFEVSVHVALLAADGRVALEKTYESGRLEAPLALSPRGVFADAEAIDRATYVAVQRLMLEAAADVKARLEGGFPPPDGETPRAPPAQP